MVCASDDGLVTSDVDLEKLESRLARIKLKTSSGTYAILAPAR